MLRSFWTVPGAVHGGQQLVVAQGLEVGHVVRGGVAEVQCQQERGAGGPHLGPQYYLLVISDYTQCTDRGEAEQQTQGLGCEAQQARAGQPQLLQQQRVQPAVTHV